MDRRSGTLMGMGIGLVVALTVFGITRFFREDIDEQLQTQAVPPAAHGAPNQRQIDELAKNISSIFDPPTGGESPPPNDSLIQRLQPRQ